MWRAACAGQRLPADAGPDDSAALWTLEHPGVQPGQAAADRPSTIGGHE